MRATLPAPITLPDAFSAAVERWIEGLRGGPLEPHLLELRQVTPALYAELVASLFGLRDEESG